MKRSYESEPLIPTGKKFKVAEYNDKELIQDFLLKNSNERIKLLDEFNLEKLYRLPFENAKRSIIALNKTATYIKNVPAYFMSILYRIERENPHTQFVFKRNLSNNNSSPENNSTQISDDSTPDSQKIIFTPPKTQKIPTQTQTQIEPESQIEEELESDLLEELDELETLKYAEEEEEVKIKKVTFIDEKFFSNKELQQLLSEMKSKLENQENIIKEMKERIVNLETKIEGNSEKDPHSILNKHF